MPHALFLGSSLAGIDRLDMLPRPPASRLSSPLMIKSPVSNYTRRLASTPSAVNVEEEAGTEMKAIAPHFDASRGQDDESPQAGSRDDLQVTPPGIQLERGEANRDAAAQRYKADLRSFDRIRWTDLHIRHATVCLV